MKRLLFTLLAFTLLLPFYVNAQEYQYINVGKEKLKVENRKILDSDGNEFVIKGIAIANVFQTDFVEERITTETLTLLKEAGFNTIRFQLNGTLFYDFTNKQFRQSNIDMFKDYLRRAEEVGMYIIVDLHGLMTNNVHSFDTSGENKWCLVSETGSPYTEDYYSLWERMATEFKSYKSVLAYELLNEPAACYETTQEAVMNSYNNLLQTTIGRIRAVDPDTIISFQPVNHFRDINDNYNYKTISVDYNPVITGTNYLYDVRHMYPRPLKGDNEGVTNVAIAYGASYVSKYGAGYTQTVTSNNFTTYQEITCEKDCKIAWLTFKPQNFTEGTTLKINAIRIYKVVDGEKRLAFETNRGDSQTKLDFYRLSNIYDDISITNNMDILGTEFQNMALGMFKDETIRVEVDVNVSAYESNSDFTWRLTKYLVEPTNDGRTILTGSSSLEKLENTFKAYDDVAKRYGSPIYLGEYCIMDQVINEYSDYKNYTDYFKEIADKYHINWIWHRMSEYPSDNGYGAYINGYTPTVANRRASMWNYIIPKMFEQKGEYSVSQVEEEIANNESNNKKKEKVANPKTGVVSVLIPSVLFASVIGYTCITIYKSDKFKSLK